VSEQDDKYSLFRLASKSESASAAVAQSEEEEEEVVEQQNWSDEADACPKVGFDGLLYSYYGKYKSIYLRTCS
jgi:hypothetical protein